MRRWPISTTGTQLTNRRSDNHNVRILQDRHADNWEYPLLSPTFMSLLSSHPVSAYGHSGHSPRRHSLRRRTSPPVPHLFSLSDATASNEDGGVAHPVERAQRIIITPKTLSPSVAFPSALSRGTGFESQHPQYLFLLPLYLGLTIQSTATIVTNTIMGDAHHSPKSAHLLRTFSLISSGYPFSKSHVTHSCCPLYSAGSRQLATTFPPVSLVPVPCDMYGTSG